MDEAVWMKLFPNGGSYSIVRDDGVNDDIAGRMFASFDEAYAVVERYYADTCCSEDSETYRIEKVPHGQQESGRS